MPRRTNDKSEAERIASVLSTRLRTFRTSRAWTQEMAAERVELSTEAYARLERGHSLPSYPTLARICDQMDTTPDVLLGYDDADRGDGQPTPSPRSRSSAADGDNGAPDGEPHDEREQAVKRIASQLRDLEPTVVSALGRLIGVLWRAQRG